MSAQPVYTSKARLKSGGLDVEAWPDDRVQMLCRQASAAVDGLTGQRFGPTVETVRLDGTGAVFALRPDVWALAAVTRVEVIPERTYRRCRCGCWRGALAGELATEDYILRPSYPYRWVEVLPAESYGTARHFPHGVGNVEIEAVWGWLEAVKSTPVSTTLAADLDTKDVSATLTDATGLVPRDLVLIGDDLMVYCDSIDDDEIAFTGLDGVLGAALPAGTAVTSYGPAPREIEELASYIAMTIYRQQVGLEAGELIDPILIRSERTDHYMYDTWNPAQLLGLKGLAGRLGSPRFDDIVVRFSTPPIPSFQD